MRIVAIEEHYATPELLAANGLDLSWLPRSRTTRWWRAWRRAWPRWTRPALTSRCSRRSARACRSSRARRRSRSRASSTTSCATPWSQRPDRFAAFGTLPTGSPDEAAAELERTVSGLGFAGALINGTTSGLFLDHAQYSALLETAAASLGVPIYLHPGAPPQPVAAAYYAGLPGQTGAMLATAGYGWHYETSLHALRLVVTGVFDRWPTLKVILGHLGEGRPFHLGRIDDVLTPLADHLAKPISAYFRENFWITTSGYFFDGPFRLAREVFGDDRIILSVDYPYSDNRRACAWLEQADLDPGVRQKIAHANADALLGLDRAAGAGGLPAPE